MRLLDLCSVLCIFVSTSAKSHKSFHNLAETKLDKTLPVQWSANVRSGIVGGVFAKAQELPWLALLYITDLTDPGYPSISICSGMVISQQHILTAAHCVHGLDNFEVDIRYKAHGTVDRSNQERSELVLSKNDIKIHEDYNPTEIVNDIAIIRANKIAEYNVPSVKLAVTAVGSRGGNIPRFYVAGWGKTESNSPSMELKKAKVQWVNLNKCNREGGFGWAHGEKNYCAYDPEMKQDSCQGDSGGPLYTIDSDGQAFVHGLVSFGAQECATNVPSVYTNVPHYTHWIQKNTNRAVKLVRTRILYNKPNSLKPVSSSAGYSRSAFSSITIMILAYLIL